MYSTLMLLCLEKEIGVFLHHYVQLVNGRRHKMSGYCLVVFIYGMQRQMPKLLLRQLLAQRKSNSGDRGHVSNLCTDVSQL